MPLAWVEPRHRVDPASARSFGGERIEHRVEIRLGENRHTQRAWAEPLGAQPALLGGLLAADIQRAMTRLLQMAERHVRQRRLADPRRAAEQHERSRHEPAAEHAVELTDARRHPLQWRRADLAQRPRRERRTALTPTLPAANTALPSGLARR